MAHNVILSTSCENFRDTTTDRSSQANFAVDLFKKKTVLMVEETGPRQNTLKSPRASEPVMQYLNAKKISNNQCKTIKFNLPHHEALEGIPITQKFS